MSILAPGFLIFLLVLLVAYYLMPQKYRWTTLLLASLQSSVPLPFPPSACS